MNSKPRILNSDAMSPLVLVCEHASRMIPQEYAGLGLDADALVSHIAWDLGVFGVASCLSELMDARLVASSVSRLVYDCNRDPSALDAIPSRSEIHDIPGNASLSPAEKANRTERFYRPFEAALSKSIADVRGVPLIVTIHSFTPVYQNVAREVEIGILHDSDSRLADAMLQLSSRYSDHAIRRNEPYGPSDNVMHTLKTHALPHGYLNVMIEIRNDLINSDKQQTAMAASLAGLLKAAIQVAQAMPSLNEGPEEGRPTCHL